MCGILGKIYFNQSRVIDKNLIRDMNNTMTHRGPDDEGYYVEGNIALAQRRLSIIDLESGHQPIYNEDRSIILVCNGEIYNYKALRSELIQAGHTFKSNTDVEVIVHMYEQMGLGFAKRLQGMFAIALWDKRKRRLVLCRDHAGIKPLYYYLDQNQLIFSSELKGISSSSDITLDINHEALVDYFYYAFIPGPKTIFKQCYKLNPGTVMTINEDKTIEENTYWKIQSSEPDDPSETDLVQRSFDLIDQSVKAHLVSDVPFGCFLSGGIDSSIVAAFMARNMDQPVKTFSIGFEDSEYNELDKAAIVAKALKTDHYEYVLSPDIEDIIIKLAHQYDEPFADPSAIPTYLVSKMATEEVKMCLSGDGGDELFAGYERYNAAVNQLSYDRIPGKIFIRFLSEKLPFNARGKTRLSLISQDRNNRYADALGIMTNSSLKNIFNRDFYNQINNYNAQQSVVKYFDNSRDFINQMGIVDYKTYLVDSNLQKVDRASMLNSLEVRVPLLDRSIVEFAYMIPGNKKIVNGNLKDILKRVSSMILPNEISQFPKKGFSVPIKHWSRKELNPMMREVIFSNNSFVGNYLEMDMVEKIFSAHTVDKVDNSRLLWSIMNLELWSNNYYTS